MEFKDGVLWAGATSVWKSVDTGKTWTQTGGFWGIISEIKFYNDQIGVVVTTSDGIKLTRDQGRTWKQILYVGASSGCCFGDSPDEIYIISGDGILEVTENGGATWDAQSLRRTPFQLIKLGPGRIAMLSGTQNEMTSVSVTTDKGKTWMPTLQQPIGVDYDSYSFAVDSCNKNLMYVANEESLSQTDGLSDIFRTTDGGATWGKVFSRPSDYLKGCVVVGPNTVYVTTAHDGLLRSTDKGDTWQTIGAPTSLVFDTRPIAVVNDDILFVADSVGTIWRTMNSGGVPMDLSGAYTLSADPPSLFDTTSIASCDASVTGTLHITATCNAKLSVQRIVGKDSAYYSLERMLPNSLQPTDSILIRFSPDGSRQYKAQLLLQLANGKEVTIDLLGKGNAPAAVTMEASHLRNDTIGATIDVPIIVRALSPFVSGEFYMHYDTSMLVYHGSVGLGGESLDINRKESTGTAILHLNGKDDPSDSLYGYARFGVYPLRDSCTSVTFDSASFPGAENCYAFTPANVEICSAVTCGSELISKFMRYGAVDLVALYPNPASHSVTLRPLTNAKILHVTFSDVLGRTLLVQEVTLDGVCTVPLEALPKGVIHVTVTAEGRTQSLQFIHQ